MRRLLATLRCDVRLQLRNGFYYAAAFTALVNVLILHWLPRESVGWLLPALLLENMLVNTFYFMAGLVLLEKGEGTIAAQAVTPLRIGEYLAAKVLSLTLLSIVEALAIAGIAMRLGFAPLPLAAGIALAAVLFSLYGFIVVARYDSINEYLMPSVLYAAVLGLPFLGYFGLWDSPLLYLHPVQAPLLILQAAFAPLAMWQWAYGLAYSALWIGIAGWLGQRVFRRFVVRTEGN